MTNIAVVIPCFNVGSNIAEVIESVFAQTRPAIDIVVIDDGSTEMSKRGWHSSRSDSRLRVIPIEDRGAGQVRNRAISLTTASYLLFVDLDYALDPTYLEKTAVLLDSDFDLDFVSSTTFGFGENGYALMPPSPNLSSVLTRVGTPITPLVRRRVWASVGGFDEQLPASIDLDFWISALEQGFRGRIIEEPLLRRCVGSESLHHSAIIPGAHADVVEIILRKHWPIIEQIGPQLLLTKEAVKFGQTLEKMRLEQMLAGLHTKLQVLDDQIDEAQVRLSELGRPRIDFSDFKRLNPISPYWGLDRGMPVDRYYIERFLRDHRSDIRGHVLEIKDPYYSELYGSAAVTKRDTLDVVSDNSQATIVADLTQADAIPDGSFDCFIITQTLHIIYEVRAALFHAQRILKPGGVLLATLPAVSRINYEDGGLDNGDFWRFTAASLDRLLGDLFPPGNFQVIACGNLKVTIAFLYGAGLHEVPEGDYTEFDPQCPLIFCVRAVKPFAMTGATARAPATSPRLAAILMYHRISELAVDPHSLCVSRTQFREHMEHLAQQHQVLSLEDLAERVVNGVLPERAIAVTIDDGTLDGLENALPILRELGIPATFFVNTERIEEAHEPWWDVLGRIFYQEGSLPAELEISLGTERCVFPIKGTLERAAAYTTIHRFLMRATLAERLQAISFLTKWSAVAIEPRNSHRLMLPGEIRRLAEQPGQTIGAHSVHHLLLPLQTRKEQESEIVNSKRDLEQLLGRPVKLFSYPYGGFSPDTVELVRAAGFRVAVTTDPIAVSAAANVYQLPRLDVKAGDASVLSRGLEQAFSRVNGLS